MLKNSLLCLFNLIKLYMSVTINSNCTELLVNYQKQRYVHIIIISICCCYIMYFVIIIQYS